MIRTNMKRLCLLAFALLVACLLQGCDGGPDNVAEVSGDVKLNGNPLPNAMVTFEAKSGTSQSRAITDENGHYELNFFGDVNGAEIGEHVVKISTFDAGNPDAEVPRPAVPEKVPAKYNIKSELVATVTEGENKLDWDLKVDGPIVQPDKVGLDDDD